MGIPNDSSCANDFTNMLQQIQVNGWYYFTYLPYFINSRHKKDKKTIHWQG